MATPRGAFSSIQAPGSCKRKARKCPQKRKKKILSWVAWPAIRWEFKDATQVRQFSEEMTEMANLNFWRTEAAGHRNKPLINILRP